jgi:ubiquinone/menaquinone biosynthesis C-methylase UbiE
MAKVTLSFEIGNFSEDSYEIMQELPRFLKNAGELYNHDIYDINITELETEYEEDEEES